MMDNKSHRILYIEDEPFQMVFSIDAIKEAGFEIIIVDNVNDLPDRIENDKFDLLLLDVMMDCPVEIFTRSETRSGFMTGVKIFEKYASTLFNGKPVIVISALNPRTPIGHKVFSFFNDRGIEVLNKPFDDKVLIEKMQKLLT